MWEDYDTGGTNEYLALRLAYHVDKKLNNTVSIFHNLAWLPALDDISNCIINADAGIRAQLTGAMFTEFKVVDQFNSQPAPGAEQNDLRFILAVGWAF